MAADLGRREASRRHRALVGLLRRTVLVAQPLDAAAGRGGRRTRPPRNDALQAGGIAAAFVLTAIFDETMRSQVALGTPQLAAGVSEAQGILVEALMTFFLMTAVFGTAIDPRGPKLGALLIGLTLSMDLSLLHISEPTRPY